MLRHVHISVLLLFLAFFSSCSSDSTDPGGGGQPAALGVNPAAGPPGTLVRLTGAAVEPAERPSYTLLVDGNAAPFAVDAEGGVTFAIPLAPDASGWPQPSAAPVDVELLRDDGVVGRAAAALTIEALPAAPGGVQRTAAALRRVRGSFELVFSVLPPASGAEGAMRAAAVAVMDSLIDGGTNSLAAFLAGDPSVWGGVEPDPALVDAILAATGAVDFLEQLAGSLAGADAALADLKEQQARGLFCRDGGPDMDLACRMQIYVVLKDYAEYFVSPTAATWANTVGLLAGLFSVGGAEVLAPAAIVSAILSIMDFVMNNLVPSFFPAVITDFSLDLQTPSIDVGGHTGSAVTIAAANLPETITLNEAVNVVLATLSFLPTHAVESFRDVLLNAASFALDLYRSILLQYEADHPGTFDDPTLATMPTLTWGPVTVTEPDLVSLFSFDSGIVDGDEGAFEWLGIAEGTADVQARTRGAGERSKVLLDHALCLGCVYAGGAFGNNSAATNTAQVEVGGGPVLEVVVSGLDGIPGAVTVAGPNGYTRVVADDTFLDDVEPGHYVLTAAEVTAEGAVYRARPNPVETWVAATDTTSVEVVYHQRGDIVVLLGGTRGSSASGQALALARTTLNDSWDPDYVLDEGYDPVQGGLPDQLTTDDCYFQDGRMLLSGYNIYSASASAPGASSEVSAMIDAGPAQTEITWTTEAAIASYDGLNTNTVSAEFRTNPYLELRLVNPSAVAGAVRVQAEVTLDKVATSVTGYVGLGYEWRDCLGYPWSPSSAPISEYFYANDETATYTANFVIAMPAEGTRSVLLSASARMTGSNSSPSYTGGYARVTGRVTMTLIHLD